MKKNRQQHRPRPEKKRQQIEVRVDDVAFGGDGLTRQDGKVIFISAAVPGEQVRVELTEDKKNFAKAVVVQRLSPAPDEVPAFCPVFLRCGGCDWQNVPYEKQLSWKASFIESALRKIAGIDRKVSIVPSPNERLYRNRIRLKAEIRDNLRFGYFAKSSHELVLIRACPIADVRVNEALKALHEAPWKGSWRGDMEVQVLADDSCLVHFTPPLPAAMEESANEHLKSGVARIATRGFFLLEEDAGTKFFTQPGQFQQVNVPGNRQLRDWVRKKVTELGAKSVVDLFCGSGNFSVQIKGPRIFGLEIAELAIVTAQENVRENDLQHAVYKSGPAHEIRAIFPELPHAVDVLITDPPRQGMAESIKDVIGLNAKDILSISCDPNTFARDLKALLEAGYELREIFGVDFFPQTYHVETVAHLTKRSD